MLRPTDNEELKRQGTTRWPVYAAWTAAILGAQALVLHLMGRVTICKCGYVKLWHGVVHSSENSQHIADWYSFTHIIHGFLFYWILSKVAPRLPVGVRFVLAVGIEAMWEVVENSPVVINRYRAETISLDYFGDSVINSVSDVVFCMIGFALARKLPVAATVGLAVAIEVVLAICIRDNLTLNVLMLLWPLAAIKHWQAAATL
jgi:hypothetical protein